MDGHRAGIGGGRCAAIAAAAAVFMAGLCGIARAGPGDVPYDGEDFSKRILLKRGEANGDAAVDLSDAIHTLSNLFGGAPYAIICPKAADGNDDGAVDISDAIWTLAALFMGTAQVPEGWPGLTLDGAEDSLPCIETCDHWETIDEVYSGINKYIIKVVDPLTGRGIPYAYLTLGDSPTPMRADANGVLEFFFPWVRGYSSKHGLVQLLRRNNPNLP
jgi:hypothetical protein